jgi:hypothetical protein
MAGDASQKTKGGPLMPRLPTISGSAFSSYPLACRRRLLRQWPRASLLAGGLMESGFAARKREHFPISCTALLNRPVWRARASPAGGGTARRGTRGIACGDRGTPTCLLVSPRLEPLDRRLCRQRMADLRSPAGHRWLRKPTVIPAGMAGIQRPRIARRLRPCHAAPGRPRRGDAF